MSRFLLIIFISIAVNCFSQTDYCPVINKAVQAARTNFESYNNFQYNTQNGLKAYLSDFSFENGSSGNIYRDTVNNETYFLQFIGSNPNAYAGIYAAIEKCLLSQNEKWTKLEAENKKGVLFTSEKSGTDITLIQGMETVSIQISRDPNKNISVVGLNFCADINKLIATCDLNFEGVRTGEGEESVLGTHYKSNIKLNNRNINGGGIDIANDIFDKTKKANTYTEIFSEADISYTELLSIAEACLPASDGWVKSESTYSKGIILTKNNIRVSISTKKIFTTDELFTHVLVVGNAF
jgi:hypothetical protein